ncbi:hypothetical protein [Stutzerimonas stutzeri]|uniref:hypothetical protein n=1 Tax=Stutzerimonas stutzeri TaxID=316 RepID=UPI0012F8ED14|nr:hypothetical protein [Stutzerimonas stutzeri]
MLLIDHSRFKVRSDDTTNGIKRRLLLPDVFDSSAEFGAGKLRMPVLLVAGECKGDDVIYILF